MGQANSACNRCSDVDQKAPKPLGEESDEEQEVEQEEGEEEEPEDDGLEEEKAQAEKQLSEGLKRGMTKGFKEAIDHAQALGLDEGTISKAEQKLEEHKAFRKKEAFEQELADFLKSDEAEDQAACEKMLAQGKDYGVNEKVLKTVQEKIAELELKKPLRPEELDQAKQFMELCTRRFVASCIQGRKAHRIDLDSGDKQSAVISLDLTLKNLSIAYGENTDSYKFSEVQINRASDVEDVADTDGFGGLKDEQKDCAVAILPGSGDPVCILEAAKAKQDEFVCGCTVLLGVGLGGSKKKSPKSSPNSSKEKPGSPKDESLRNAADAEEDQGNKQPSPKDKKGKDSKGKKKEPDPPPPPPPATDPEEEEVEGSEAEEGSEVEESE